VAELRARLPRLMLRDERRLRRRLDQARRNRDADARMRTLGTLADAVAEAEQRVARRRAAVPAISYPDTLPIAAHVDEIAQAISDHQVVVVAGETGSGTPSRAASRRARWRSGSPRSWRLRWVTSSATRSASTGGVQTTRS
jgi:hypothetical protein